LTADKPRLEKMKESWFERIKKENAAKPMPS
jgi:hypothetical protein